MGEALLEVEEVDGAGTEEVLLFLREEGSACARVILLYLKRNLNYRENRERTGEWFTCSWPKDQFDRENKF